MIHLKQAFIEKNYYASFANLMQAVQSSTISPWTYELVPKDIIFTLADKEYWVPQFYVKITNDFIDTCFYFGWRALDVSIRNI